LQNNEQLKSELTLDTQWAIQIAATANSSRQRPGKAIYCKIQEIVDEEVPFAPIFTWNNLYGKKSDVKEYKVNGYVKDQTWNVQEWHWG